MRDMRDVFDAREYLQHYFVAPNVEDRFALPLWVEQVSQLRPGAHVLEYGGGPALYSVLTLARRASRIHFCDFVPAALSEVQAWIARDARAHNWRPYTRYILELEGGPHHDAAANQRESTLRRAMQRISECDARTTDMLPDPQPPYDAITAHHCLDVAARDAHDFKRMVRHLAGWLAPGGLFLLSTTTGTTRYTVDGTVFACLDLSREEVSRSLIEADMDPARLTHASMPVAGEEYTALHLFAGWKRS